MSHETVLGTGIDLVENLRMRSILRRWGRRFTERVFLLEERRYCDGKANPASHYAGRFAVKESVTKALGTGVGPHMSWLDIEVVRDELTGAPGVRLSERARAYVEARGVRRIWVSLSHTRNYAVAHALLTGDAGKEGQGPK